jgi:hypothetical protein
MISDGKVDANGLIYSNAMITEKDGYEAMLYMLKAYLEATGSTDLTDILSGGEYWLEVGRPADSAFWEYWLEAVEKVKKDGPPPLKVLLSTPMDD